MSVLTSGFFATAGSTTGGMGLMGAVECARMTQQKKIM